MLCSQNYPADAGACLVTPVRYRHYIQAGGQTIAIHTEYSTGTGATTDYLHHDHLGSVVAITSGTGTLTERLSYDPWGKRRNATTNAWLSLGPGSQLLPATLALLPRGYTSHEHLDKLGLIHMKGRVYDPELGRFLSADPLIQFPESTQGFDRYAYVGNSPLSYTDPSGHGLLGIVGSIVSFFHPPLGAALIAVDGYMEGGLQGALFSVASMAAAQGVRALYGPVGNFGHELARAATHGLIQGSLSAAQGGKFGAGFLSGGVSSGYGSTFGQMGGRVTNVIGAAVVGGTVSRIGGGKFANGAVTGAFVQAFGDAAGGGASDDAVDEYVEGNLTKDISAHEADELFYEARWAAEMAGEDTSNITFDNRIAVATGRGKGPANYEFFDDRRSALQAARGGRGFVGGFHDAANRGSITIYRNAFMTDISRIQFGTGRFGWSTQHIPAGFQSGLFQIGHEIGHRNVSGESAANVYGAGVLSRYCSQYGGC
jgi:RHS repeat-associated protein